MGEDREHNLKPTEQRGGAPPGEREAEEKGPWAARAAEGVVPPELGGSDAPDETLPDDPELGSSVVGGSAGSHEPATEGGITRSAGDRADATSDGGPTPPEGPEPDLKDAAAGPRAADVEAAD